MEAKDDFDRIAETLKISREVATEYFWKVRNQFGGYPDTYPRPSLAENILLHYKRPLQVMEVVDEIRRERRGTLDRERITLDGIDVCPFGKPKTQKCAICDQKALKDWTCID